MNQATITPADWVEALKSGAYSRGENKLYQFEDDEMTHTQFCCLGVLGELLNIDMDGDDEYLDEELIPEWLSMQNQTDLGHLNDDFHTGKRWDDSTTEVNLTDGVKGFYNVIDYIESL